MTDKSMWRKTGMIATGGTVSTIAGTDALWLATDAGLFGQPDSGGWQPLPQGQPLNQLSTLAAQGQVLLAGNAQGQLVFSTNGGQSWYESQISEANAAITWLTLAPNFLESGLAWAATDGAGILRTTDGGKRWRPANFGLQEFSVWALAVPPTWGRREIVFAATPDGVYRSPNGGRAWKKSAAGLADAVVQTMAVSPKFEADRTVFAGTESCGIFRSTDAGKTWTPCNTGLAIDGGDLPLVNALWLTPQTVSGFDCVAASGDGRLFHSADGGAQWRQVDAPGVPVLCLGGTGQQLFAGLYQQGLRQSADGGQTWIATPDFAAHSITRLHSSGDALFAFGPLGQAWQSHQSNKVWEPVSLPHDTPLLTLAVSPAPENRCMLAAATTGLFRSQDGGGNWQTVLPDTEVLAVHFSPDFAVDGTVWAAASSGSLWRSVDGGQSWDKRPAPKSGQPIVLLVGNKQNLVAATFSAQNQQVILWQSGDSGSTWQQWQQAKIRWPSVQVGWIDSMAVVSIDRRCWISGSSGWERVLETDQPIVRLVQSPSGNQLILLTAQQVFFSDNGRRWTNWSDGLPNEPLLDLALLPAGDGSVTAVILTTGGGLWQRTG
jgi:photosystem II stability/assembly factor-like uncharacterized protein